MGWRGVERWRGTTPHGAVWHVDLLQLEPLPPMPGGTWRVEWWQPGSIRASKTFPASDTGKADARALCAAKRDAITAKWVNLSEIDIRRPT